MLKPRGVDFFLRSTLLFHPQTYFFSEKHRGVRFHQFKSPPLWREETKSHEVSRRVGSRRNTQNLLRFVFLFVRVSVGRSVHPLGTKTNICTELHVNLFQDLLKIFFSLRAKLWLFVFSSNIWRLLFYFTSLVIRSVWGYRTWVPHGTRPPGWGLTPVRSEVRLYPRYNN